jgi:hypothetical protein
VHLRDTGHTVADIVTKTGIPRTSLYRHLPPRPAPLLTVATPHPRPDDQPATDLPKAGGVASARVPPARDELLEAVDWPDGYRPPCPACTRPTSGLREQWVRRTGVREPVVAVRAQPCGCAVDEHAAALQQAAGPGPASS